MSRCEELIDGDDHEGLEDYVRQLSRANRTALFEMKTQEGFSLLHMCAFKSKAKAFYQLMLFVKEVLAESNSYETEEAFKIWLNAQTFKDKFAALHYASFRGNIDQCRVLLEAGAELMIKNRHGLNVLHIAAQGDQPASLYYFHKIQGIPIDCRDARGSTPLHWACFSCSELAAIYIMSWSSEDLLKI
mmetsp:Transcript_4709/g.8036  ORF Transcript_4709/g.8036 Transcript_4709/m.8036 type:complete len:188 (+) Transcript_4709:387-950(+)